MLKPRIIDVLKNYQKIILSKLVNSVTELCMIACRRAGKTYVLLFYSMLLCCFYSGFMPRSLQEELISLKLLGLAQRKQKVDRRFRILYLTPKSYQAKDIMKEMGPALVDKFNSFNWGAKFKYANNSIEMVNGPFVIIADGVELKSAGLRGGGADIVILDEIQQVPWSKIKDAVVPVLKETRGFLIRAGTANGEASTLEMVKQFTEQPDKELVVTTIDDLIALGDETEEGKQALIDMFYNGDPNDPSFLQEFMCDFNLPVKGAVLKNWKRVERERLPSTSDIPTTTVAAMDIGYDGYVVIVAELRPDLTMTLLHSERIINATLDNDNEEALTTEMCERIRQAQEDGKIPHIDYLIIPPDGNAKNTTTRNTDAKLWKQSGVADTICRSKRHASSTQHIRMMKEHMNSVFVAPEFDKDTMQDLIMCRYAVDSRDMPTGERFHDRYSHSFDCKGYLTTTCHATIVVWPKVEDYEYDNVINLRAKALNKVLPKSQKEKMKDLLLERKAEMKDKLVVYQGNQWV